jgi:ABC-type uncharacterized transport system permease subunit
MIALACVAIALYLVASWRLGRYAAGTASQSAAPPGHAIALGSFAACAHLGVHVTAWVQSGGVDLRFFAALSLVALGMAALSTRVALNQRFDVLGGVVYPLAALFAGAYAAQGSGPVASLDWRLTLHAMLALLAYATLALAALLALMLWLQESALRRRQLDAPVLRWLPPLTELESLLFRSIAAGFALLSAALLSGGLFVDDLLAQHLVHKTVLSVLSWLVFGALLLGRARYGWRGRRAVRMTLGAMALLLLAFFGSKFVLEMVLQ